MPRMIAGIGEAGRVSITWQANGEAHPAFRLRWQERGGPKVTLPTRRGSARASSNAA